jgi:nucleotide-binding universal stress UspA family protein
MTPNEAAEAVFQALCAHARKNGADVGMSRVELQAVAGLTEESMMMALRALQGLGDLQVRFIGSDPDRIALGASWRGRCDTRPS